MSKGNATGIVRVSDTHLLKLVLFHITNLDFLRSPASFRVDACGSKTAQKGRLGAIIGIRQAVYVANERNLKVKVCFVKVH